MPVSRRRYTPFRRLFAASLAVIALVAGGSIAVAPAYAASPSLFLGAFDYGNSNAPVVGLELTAQLVGGGPTTTVATDATGEAIFSLDPGSYNVTTEDDGVYRVQERSFEVLDGYTTHTSFTMAKRAVLTGTVPAAAVGHTTISAFIAYGGWTPAPSVTTWVGNAFTVVINDDWINQYGYDATLFFDVDDSISYRDTYLSGRTTIASVSPGAGSVLTSISASVSVDPVGLIAVGKISGHIEGPFGDLDGATATATSDGGSTLYTATTDSDGNYTIYVPDADATYATFASADGYNESPTSTSVQLDSGNGRNAAGVDFSLHTADATVSGNVVDQAADPYAVEYYLYPYDSGTGAFSTSPSGYGPAADFSIDGLPSGDYRLAFYDSTTSSFLPTTEHTASNVVDGTTIAGPVTELSDRSGGDCYLSFTVAPDEGDYVFSDIAVDPSVDYTVCDQGASGGTFEGDVTNAASVSGPLSAELYAASNPYWAVDTVAVDPGGHFELQGVTNADDYFVLIRTPEDAEWFDTYQGGLIVAQTDAADVSGVTLTAGENSTGNDVTLVPATVFSGTLTSGGNPIESACVFTQDQNDTSVYWCDETDAAGMFHIKAAVGGDYILATTPYGYIPQFYPDAIDPTSPKIWSSTPQTTFSGLDFDLAPSPPSIYGYVYTDSIYGATSDDVTVHLYRQIGSGWGEVGSFELDPSDPGYFFFDSDDVFPDDGTLPAGNYRLRFEAADGSWLPISEFVADGNDTVPSPAACFVDLAGVGPGAARALYTLIDPSAPVACDDEASAPNGAVAGTLTESAVLGAGPIEGQTVVLKNSVGGTAATTVTDVNGAYSFASIPSGSYSLFIPTRDHVPGEHSYVEQTVSGILVAGGASIDTIALTRYGNITGLIDNWVPTSSPTEAYALVDQGVYDYVGVNGISVEVQADGSFEVPGIDEDGYYTLYFSGPEDSPFMDGFYLGAGDSTFGNDFQGTAEQDYSVGTFDLVEAQHITGTVRTSDGAPLAGALVSALDGTWGYEVDTLSHADGSYVLRVHPDDVVPGLGIFVSASKTGYIDQIYLDANVTGCGCGVVPVEVGQLGDPASDGIDFGLFPEGSILFDVYDYFDDETGQGETAYPGVVNHIYKKVTGGWQEITTSTSDIDGLSVAGVQSPGDYRVRLSIGALWLPIEQYYDFGIDSDPHTPTAACYVDFDDLLADDYLVLNFQADEDAAPGDCAGEPAIVTPSSSGGTTTHHHASTFTTTTVAPSADPTVTPSPVPSASPAPDTTDEPTAPSREDGATPRSNPAPGIAWWVWLLAVLGVLIVGGVGFFIVRRR